MKYLCALLLLVATSAAAQPPVSPASGDRVRVRVSESEWVTGTLRQVDHETVHIESDGKMTPVPRPAIRDLEVSLGSHRHTGRGAFRGFCIGGGLALIAVVTDDGPKSDVDPFLVTAVLGGAGAAIGAAIGYFNRTEEWKPVPLTSLSLAPSFDGESFGLALKIQFP